MFAKIRVLGIGIVTGAVAIVVTVSAYQGSPVNRPWPPEVQKVSDESPALSPAESLKTFYMPPGYRIELVASEPLVQDPVAIDWDPDGRLWVVEMPEYLRDLQTPEPNLDPVGRVIVLEDTNNDGTMDKRTVFADGLIQARAVKVLDRGVLVGEPPNVWLMHDTNGDLKMDTKELVATGYGRREGGVESNANSFYWGLDNVMHSAGNLDIALRLKDGKFDVIPSLSRGEWGVTQDDAGRTYRNTNESALHVDFVPTEYFSRNPNLLRTRGSYEPLTDPQGDVNEVWPVRPNPGTNRAYQFGIDRADGTLKDFTAVCSPLVYRGDRLPAELYGNVFVAEPAANLVARIIVSDDGTTLRAKKAYAKGEFLASTDERFRPVFLTNAPDGTLYIADLYRGNIQDRASTTIYLRDRIIRMKLDAPIGLGRIYRVMHESTRRDVKPALSKATPAQLVTALSHPNGWWRDTAQRLLVERGAKTVLPTLKTLATTSKDARVRMHALWTLDGNDSIDVATVTTALGDTSRDVRASAIRIAERWLGDAKSPIQAPVLKRLDDPDWAVQQQLAASVGAIAPGSRETTAAALLEKRAEDPVVMDAALAGLRGSESGVLEKLLQGSGPQTPARSTAITMIAASLVRGAQDAPVQNLFTWIADAGRPEWQRSALVRGAEVALLGAAMPAPARGRAGAGPRADLPSGVTPPCPTCPGGRAGPGGAYAFQDARGGGAAAAPAAAAAGRAGRGGRGGAGGPRLRLNREPVSLSGMVAGGGDLGTRATNLLARIEWPGKPGAAAPLPPLTATEQQHFNAGQEVYKNICQSCHQSDGRGQARLAASLIGSDLALGPAEITARILLNGKEGTVGLMPPIGATLTDDQVANVLTYIRREWGQDGTPVEAATVKSVRAATASRTRAWTNDELIALMPR